MTSSRPLGMVASRRTGRHGHRGRHLAFGATAAGSATLVGPDESAVGSVSGGCVESAVYALAQEVVADGHPVLQRYGVSDNDAFAVGLTCGGILDVFVEKVSQQTFPELADIAADIQAGRPVAVQQLSNIRTSPGSACE